MTNTLQRRIFIHIHIYMSDTLFHDYNSMYNNKNTIKDKVIYMQSVAQQKCMWTETHCESLQHNNSEVI